MPRRIEVYLNVDNGAKYFISGSIVSVYFSVWRAIIRFSDFILEQFVSLRVSKSLELLIETLGNPYSKGSRDGF